MGRFNVSKYDPKNDSSKGYKPQTDAGLPAVVINRNGQTAGVADVLCHCGCGDEPQGKNAKFRMGHDARFKGVLIRAHLAGLPIVIVYSSHQETREAIDVAADYDNEKYSWSDALRRADKSQGPTVRAKLEAANKSVLKKATGPQVGDRRLIKVGRWEYTGQVAAVYAVDGEVEIEYVTKSGDTKTVRQPITTEV